MSISAKKEKVTSVRGVNLGKTNFERVPSNRWMEIKLGADEIKQLLGGRVSGKKILTKRYINYPLYLYGFINKAHSMSLATHPAKVGKVHTLFKQRKFRSLNEWKKWYNKKYPNAVKEATSLICKTIKEGIGTVKKSHKKYIRCFVENLIFNQTYTGLNVQEAIFMKMAKITKKKYRPSTAKEDSAGIDGFIGEIPVSIKPITSPVKKKAGVKRVNYKIDEENYILSFTFSM
jgi:hypothetical protein